MSKGKVLEENKKRTHYRSLCPKHVVEFELDATEDEKRKLFALNERVRKGSNQVVGIMRKRLDQLTRTKKYRALQKDYKWKAEHMDALKKKFESSADAKNGMEFENSKDYPAYKKLESGKKKTGKAMSAMQKEYGVTTGDVQELIGQAAKDFNFAAAIAQRRGDNIWRGVEKVLYQGAKDLHFRKFEDFPTMHAKQIDRTFVLKVDKETEQLVVQIKTVDGLRPLPFLVPAKDYFLADEYNALLDYMGHDGTGQEKEAVARMEATKEVVPVFRPCYCAIRCQKIRGKLRCYVQITVAADPMPKYDRYGRRRHVPGKGRVGCDIGTQSVAACADKAVDLFNLGERNQDALRKDRMRKAFLLRKMDASRRKTNPDRYNKDGTYKKGSHGPWVRSNKYQKYKAELREIDRKEAATRMYANRENANYLRSLGDVLITEPSNTKALAKRSQKKAERQEKESVIKKKDGTEKVVRKFKRKKRFGKSIGSRSPGQFQAELKKKFGNGYHEVPIATYRASQYDFELDDYIKKKLSERWHNLPDGRRVQRDLMSSFLMYCADDEIQHIDRNRCLVKFDEFWKMHQACIERIVTKHLQICNSGIAAT